jgi:hypothetical protein
MCSTVDRLIPDACGGPCSQPSQVCGFTICYLLFSVVQAVTATALAAVMMPALLRVKVKNNSAPLVVVVEIMYGFSHLVLT